MRRPTPRLPPVLVALLIPLLQLPAQSLPPADERAQNVVTLNTPRVFPKINSRSDWQNRADEIREQILVSCGLWPLPEKTPLNAQIFGKVVRDDYSIEKVHIETFPGFFLAGNLYRPVGQGDGPFPAILNPHGHWANGRLHDATDGSLPARCIHFARQGMIAFSYDMVGYNDTFFPDHPIEGQNFYKRHRLFASDPAALLWNINLMGLQTWNSIRALDFLDSLPDSDKSRLACTGASGGATQTFMLGAIDGRLAAVAPVVMVSHSMQGGCGCENAPGLRVRFSNMEIAAAAAPKPQLLVAATGDWTKETPTIEGPAIESIYRLVRAPDKFQHVIFDFKHNYNQTSREAVYGWFGQWLLKHPEPASLIESAYTRETEDTLRVWADGKPPESALTEKQFIDSLVQRHDEQFTALTPLDRTSLKDFKAAMTPAWQHTMQLEFPEWDLVRQLSAPARKGNYTALRGFIGRQGKGDRIPILHLLPRRSSSRFTVVLAHPQGRAAWLDDSGEPTGLARILLDRGQSVVLFDAFLTGDLADETASKQRDHFANFFPVYNKTDLQERVQDVVTVCAYAKRHGRAPRVILCGAGRAGFWAMLAAPAVDAIVADCNALKISDSHYLERDLFVPGIRRIGGFEGAASLAVPHPALLHNNAGRFPVSFLMSTYSAARSSRSLRIEVGQLDDPSIARWILGL